MRRLTPDNPIYNRLVTTLALKLPRVTVLDLAWFNRHESEFGFACYVLYVRCDDIVHPEKGRLMLKIPFSDRLKEEDVVDVALPAIEDERLAFAHWLEK